MGRTKHLESFTGSITPSVKEKGSLAKQGCSAPLNKESIWEEVDRLPPKVKPYNLLKIPGHQFIRKEPLTEEPVANFGRRRYARRPY